jgi:hypothetical protein
LLSAGNELRFPLAGQLEHEFDSGPLIAPNVGRPARFELAATDPEDEKVWVVPVPRVPCALSWSSPWVMARPDVTPVNTPVFGLNWLKVSARVATGFGPVLNEVL